MFGFDGSGLNDIEWAKREIQKLRSLADDLEMLIEGVPPSKALLAGSPFIERWTVYGRPMVALSGIVTNHPEAGPAIAPWQTSPIVVAAQKEGWIRTWDHFYRLGGKEDGKHFPWNSPSRDLGDVE